jgi:hypothetical protein
LTVHVKVARGEMIWNHGCGWSGFEDELTPHYYNDILIGYECPKCGEEWPFDDEPELQFQLYCEQPEDEWIPTNRDKKLQSRKTK